MRTWVVLVMTAAVLREAEGRERDKRYLFINPSAPVTLGFLVNMPISLALPTLAPVNSGRSFNPNGLYEGEELPEDLMWEPAYEQSLSRLFAYFSHLDLSTMSCQEQLICELNAEPESFSPISQIFLKELRLLNGPVETTRESLMWRYVSAAREGFASPIERCSAAYPSCPMEADRILNMPVLRVWQYIASKLNMQLI
ncbi:uncharacterized protein [Procambarus clarkii]|uniref:uncharacterized protein n=1 Tax=Procambarus clarkii TaxID=6728 RepID=UPI001E674028|nr:uncharacterized protein LOC123762827 [Procambarus clarkii]